MDDTDLEIVRVSETLMETEMSATEALEVKAMHVPCNVVSDVRSLSCTASHRQYGVQMADMEGGGGGVLHCHVNWDNFRY